MERYTSPMTAEIAGLYRLHRRGIGEMWHLMALVYRWWRLCITQVYTFPKTFQRLSLLLNLHRVLLAHLESPETAQAVMNVPPATWQQQIGQYVSHVRLEVSASPVPLHALLAIILHRITKKLPVLASK